ncbi:MAG TPA: DUF2891 domain-containing protein [Gammaproteobacteria bacterium]|nr:DUF2891 domain-containing protein [Gammaproteobacteria bacterium]
MKVSEADLDAGTRALLERLAQMALANLGREYPNHLMHLLESDADAAAPRALHPVFYGAYDWHSAVHNYWMLVRLLRLLPAGAFAPGARAFIASQLTAANVERECRYVAHPRRSSFERPYGLAWLLQLVAELVEWNSAEARAWRVTLAPLEGLAAQRFKDWLPKLPYPIRSGEHSQTAFAFGMVHDWSRVMRDDGMRALIEARARAFHSQDVDAPLAYEPSGQDFLSPVLAEADLMRRVLGQAEYARWLRSFLPRIPTDGSVSWLKPALSPDPSDPKLAHLDGLNLSRAWMLQGIAAGLPAADERREALLAAAGAHAEAGLAGIRAELYEGSHWLPSFAVYLLTARGLP